MTTFEEDVEAHDPLLPLYVTVIVRVEELEDPVIDGMIIVVVWAVSGYCATSRRSVDSSNVYDLSMRMSSVMLKLV